MSVCVTAYVPVHVIDSPTASVVFGQLIGDTFGSVTVTPCNVTLPVFVTTNVYEINSPGSATPFAPASNVPSSTDCSDAFCGNCSVLSSSSGPDSVESAVA